MDTAAAKGGGDDLGPNVRTSVLTLLFKALYTLLSLGSAPSVLWGQREVGRGSGLDPRCLSASMATLGIWHRFAWVQIPPGYSLAVWSQASCLTSLSLNLFFCKMVVGRLRGHSEIMADRGKVELGVSVLPITIPKEDYCFITNTHSAEGEGL